MGPARWLTQHVDIGQTARARARRHVWSVLPDGLPTSKVADTELGEVSCSTSTR
ncbi:hypothetical protein [Mycobacterium sp.]|jgi:hypothetical protein|uniref:hypothetical protein n=1 Tax=Mycobacterium sp. TaxID=1785 RepID=UPI003341C875